MGLPTRRAGIQFGRRAALSCARAGWWKGLRRRGPTATSTPWTPTAVNASGASRPAATCTPSLPRSTAPSSSALRTETCTPLTPPAASCSGSARPSSQPAVSLAEDGVLYFNTDGSIIYALDPVSGEEIWQSGVDADHLLLHAVDEGMIFAAAGDKLYALDTATGDLLWHFPAGDRLLSFGVRRRGGVLHHARQIRICSGDKRGPTSVARGKPETMSTQHR